MKRRNVSGLTEWALVAAASLLLVAGAVAAVLGDGTSGLARGAAGLAVLALQHGLATRRLAVSRPEPEGRCGATFPRVIGQGDLVCWYHPGHAGEWHRDQDGSEWRSRVLATPPASAESFEDRRDVWTKEGQ